LDDLPIHIRPDLPAARVRTQRTQWVQAITASRSSHHQCFAATKNLLTTCEEPAGIGCVQTFSGRHLNVGSDGTVEMSAEDAKYLIPYGWIKLAEWSCDDVD
jgi:hypothetical protein